MIIKLKQAICWKAQNRLTNEVLNIHTKESSVMDSHRLPDVWNIKIQRIPNVAFITQGTHPIPDWATIHTILIVVKGWNTTNILIHIAQVARTFVLIENRGTSNFPDNRTTIIVATLLESLSN